MSGTVVGMWDMVKGVVPAFLELLLYSFSVQYNNHYI